MLLVAPSGPVAEWSHSLSQIVTDVVRLRTLNLGDYKLVS